MDKTKQQILDILQKHLDKADKALHDSKDLTSAMGHAAVVNELRVLITELKAI